MKAIAFTRPLPIEAQDSLVELDLPLPEYGPRDLLVNVRAVSVKSGGYEGAGRAAPGLGVGQHRQTTGAWLGCFGRGGGQRPAVTAFDVGDEVYYAGALDRPGSNAEYQAVDERLVGRKPQSIGFAEAAALPLTGITAWNCCSIGLAFVKARAALPCWSVELPAVWARFSCNWPVDSRD